MFTQQFFVVPNVYHTDGYHGNTITYDSFALVTGSSALADGAKLLGFIALNAGADGYVQVFDGYAQPSVDSVPLVSVKVSAGVQANLDCSAFNCVPVSKGIVIALSSTGTIYTDAGAHMFLTAFWI